MHPFGRVHIRYKWWVLITETDVPCKKMYIFKKIAEPFKRYPFIIKHVLRTQLNSRGVKKGLDKYSVNFLQPY